MELRLSADGGTILSMTEELDARLDTLEAAVLALTASMMGRLSFYSDDQARDERGRWSAGGSGGASMAEFQKPAGRESTTQRADRIKGALEKAGFGKQVTVQKSNLGVHVMPKGRGGKGGGDAYTKVFEDHHADGIRNVLKATGDTPHEPALGGRQPGAEEHVRSASDAATYGGHEGTHQFIV
jgi:hypothetical protein